MRLLDGSKSHFHFNFDLVRIDQTPGLTGMKYDGTSYHLSEILRIETFGPQEKGGDKAVAGAAVGSLLFGVVGAVAGAAIGSRKKRTQAFCIYFNDGEYVIPEFDLSKFNEARDASRPQATKNLLEQPAESQQP